MEDDDIGGTLSPVIDESILQQLKTHEKPTIRLRSLRLLGESIPASLHDEIRTCPRVQTLLQAREPDGTLRPVGHADQKWYGAHWVLVDLANLEYPRGDESLYPIRDQVYDTWLDPTYYRTFECTKPSHAYSRKGVPVMVGRPRRCVASQQGNALYSSVKLGIADYRAHELVRLLLGRQWLDGGRHGDESAVFGAGLSTLLAVRSALRSYCDGGRGCPASSRCRSPPRLGSACSISRFPRTAPSPVGRYPPVRPASPPRGVSESGTKSRA
jgi:hypothetical protein